MMYVLMLMIAGGGMQQRDRYLTEESCVEAGRAVMLAESPPIRGYACVPSIMIEPKEKSRD